LLRSCVRRPHRRNVAPLSREARPKYSGHYGARPSIGRRFRGGHCAVKVDSDRGVDVPVQQPRPVRHGVPEWKPVLGNAVTSWNESEILEARRRILRAAQGMVAGKLSYVEGARKIVAAAATARLDERDADLLSFVAVDSETDALPFGEMREHWQAAALAALQPEIDQKETWARGLGEPHCRNLVERFFECPKSKLEFVAPGGS